MGNCCSSIYNDLKIEKNDWKIRGSIRLSTIGGATCPLPHTALTIHLFKIQKSCQEINGKKEITAKAALIQSFGSSSKPRTYKERYALMNANRLLATLYLLIVFFFYFITPTMFLTSLRDYLKSAPRKNILEREILREKIVTF